MKIKLTSKALSSLTTIIIKDGNLGKDFFIDELKSEIAEFIIQFISGCGVAHIDKLFMSDLIKEDSITELAEDLCKKYGCNTDIYTMLLLLENLEII